MGDIPIAALDIIAIPNEIKHVPIISDVILFAIVVLFLFLYIYCHTPLAQRRSPWLAPVAVSAAD
jgi:hypothetical protein